MSLIPTSLSDGDIVVMSLIPTSLSDGDIVVMSLILTSLSDGDNVIRQQKSPPIRRRASKTIAIYDDAPIGRAEDLQTPQETEVQAMSASPAEALRESARAARSGP